MWVSSQFGVIRRLPRLPQVPSLHGHEQRDQGGRTFTLEASEAFALLVAIAEQAGLHDPNSKVPLCVFNIFQAVLDSHQWELCFSALCPFLFQDNVLNIINQIMDVCIPQDRAPRDFCVKFPEEIRHDNLAGQLWFGAEVARSFLGPGSRCGGLCSCFLMKLAYVHLRVQGPGVFPAKAPPARAYGWHVLSL